MSCVRPGSAGVRCSAVDSTAARRLAAGGAWARRSGPNKKTVRRSVVGGAWVRGSKSQKRFAVQSLAVWRFAARQLAEHGFAVRPFDCAKTLCSLIGKTRVRCLDIGSTRVRLSAIDKNAGSFSSHWDNEGSPFGRWDNEGSPSGHRQNEGSPFVHPGGNFGFKQRESAPDFAEWQKCEPQLMSRAALMRTARIPVESPSTPSILGDRSSDLNQLLASWIMKTRLLVDSRYFRCWNRDRWPYLDISDAGTEIAGSISAGQMAETRIPAPSYRPRRRERGCWLAIGSGGGWRKHGPWSRFRPSFISDPAFTSRFDFVFASGFVSDIGWQKAASGLAREEWIVQVRTEESLRGGGPVLMFTRKWSEWSPLFERRGH